MENRKPALLVMDVQNAIVDMLPDGSPVLDSLSSAITIARKHDIPVIYAVVGFRRGYPEVSPNNKSFSQIKGGSAGFDTKEATRVHASVAPQPDDIVITKKRVSAFTGSDLEVVLRSLGISDLVLTGIATSGVVLSTIREAADKDYHLAVLSDCCADRDEEVHHVLMTKVFARQADIINTQELEAKLQNER